MTRAWLSISSRSRAPCGSSRRGSITGTSTPCRRSTASARRPRGSPPGSSTASRPGCRPRRSSRSPSGRGRTARPPTGPDGKVAPALTATLPTASVPSPMKMKRLLPIALVAVPLAAGCGGKQTPVARVEVEPSQVRLPFSQVQTVRLTWTPSMALEGETPTVFVHLLDGKRKVVRTFDHPFPQRWREGTPVSYDLKLYQSALAPPLPAGKYQMTLGLYNKEGKRWALDGLGEPKSRNEYDAAKVEVPAQSPNPRFAFSP